MKALSPSLSLIRPRRRLLWLGTSILLGLFTGLTQANYHAGDFRDQFAFASDVPFTVSISGESIELANNGALASGLGSLPYQETLENQTLIWARDTVTLHFDRPPKSLQVLSFTRRSPDPYEIIIFSYYSYLSSNLKSRLGLFFTPPFLSTYRAGASWSADTSSNLGTEWTLDPALLGLNKVGNYHALAFWGTFLKYSLLHIFLFGLTMLPFFRLTKRRIRALGTFLNHRILITLLLLLLPTWGFYAYQLSVEANVFGAGLLAGMTIWGSLTLFGFLLYATLISVLWAWVARTPRLLQLIVLLLVLAIYIIVIVQASFLAFTSSHISLVYFTMLTGETFWLFFDVLPALLLLALLGICFYLISSAKKRPKFPWFFLNFLPFFLLASYSLSFSTSLNLQKKGYPIYSPSQAVGRLAFSPFLNPPLEFNREFVRYLKLVFVPNEQGINIQPFTREDRDISRELGLNIGAEASRFPAGRKPFKRIILLTIEGYRLAYIPEFNEKIAGIVKDYPFFSRPEVQKARKQNYYASTAFTTRSLKTAMMSHLNSQTTSFNVGDLAGYPALPHLLKEAGFKTVFIRTASRGFDQFGELFTALGIEEVLELEDLRFVRPQDYADAGLNEPTAWAYPSRLLFREVMGHLQEAEATNTPIFTLIINTDTHNPPVGMAMTNPAHYGSLVYPNAEVDPKAVTKAVANTLISTYRFAYDLDLFYEEMKTSGLLDDETLLIISADHSQGAVDETFFPSDRQQKLFDEIPFIVLSGREFPDFNQSIYASHLDMAPTILDLMGMEKPAGYWGHSLYNADSAGRRAWFTYNEGYIYTKDGREEKEWILDFEPKLKSLFNKFLVQKNS